jgi:hypothetical protein
MSATKPIKAASNTASDLYNAILQYYSRAVAANQPATAQGLLQYIQTGDFAGIPAEAKIIVQSVLKGTAFESSPEALVSAAKVPGQGAKQQTMSPVQGNVSEQGAVANAGGNPVEQFMKDNPVPGTPTTTPAGPPRIPTGTGTATSPTPRGLGVTGTPQQGSLNLGNAGTAGAEMAVSDPEFLLNLGLENAGFDTSQAMGMLGESSKKALAPYAVLLQQIRGLQGGGEPTKGLTGDMVQGIVGDLGSYNTPGGDFYGNMRNKLTGIANDRGIQSLLSDTEDTRGMVNMLGDLQGGALGGANPMVIDAYKNRLRRVANEYKRASLGGEAGTFIDWLMQQPSEVRDRIFPGMK